VSLLDVDEALQRVLDQVMPLDAEWVPLAESVGRVSAQEIRAGRPLPAWDNAAMDGYAVRAEDVPTTPVTLPMVDAVAAGDRGDRPVKNGTAVRIFTGAPLPPGADTVILQEDSELTGQHVRFLETPRPGQHVRRRGTDTRENEVVLPVGRLITPGDISAIAGQGQATLLAAPSRCSASFGKTSDLTFYRTPDLCHFRSHHTQKGESKLLDTCQTRLSPLPRRRFFDGSRR